MREDENEMNLDEENLAESEDLQGESQNINYTPHNDDEVGEDKIHHLGGMYQN